MNSRSLQRLQGSAKAPCHLFWHPKPNHDTSLLHSVTIHADSGEAHSNYTADLFQLGDEIGPQRRRSVVEQEDPFAVNVFGLSDRAHF
jgi:hypothetical protein